ncbi:LPS O-antigen chain length determinant protein WzzB [Pseudomonas sp. JQ36]
MLVSQKNKGSDTIMPNSHDFEPRVDEIDVLEIFRMLFSQKLLILSVTGLFVLVAVLYANLSVPVFEAKVYVLPPKQSQIVSFNIGRDKNSELVPFSGKDVYDVFLRNLQSESLKRAFFEDTYLHSLSEAEKKQSPDMLYLTFSSRLKISPPGKDLVDRYTVAFQGYDPKQAADWAAGYINRAGVVATQEVIQNALREAQGKARNLDQQMDMHRERARKTREDSIVQLREALKISEAIGLEKPLIISGNLSADLSGSMEGPLIYMRGAKALRAEIENLEAREADDPFIEDLRKLEASSDLLKGLNIPEQDVAVYREDGEIQLPESPIKPKKVFIYAVGALLGLALGVLLALFRGFVTREKPVGQDKG